MVIACTRDCYDTCIFDDNYKPLNIFPINGFTCSRGLKDLERNGKNRILSAIIDGKEVSINDAINYVARKLKEVLKKGKERIIHVDYDGNQGLLTWYYPRRLWNLLGVSSTDYSICSAEGHKAIELHYGTSMGALPEEFLNYDSFVIWGSEASISFIHGWKLMSNKYKVVIDVRLSETAKKSEKSFIINPSSDVFLAIGIIKKLFEKNWVSPKAYEILDDVNKLKSYVELFEMSKIVKYVGISEEEIEEIARIYYERKPLTIIGFALGRTINGGDAISLISLIPALVGNRRGFFYSNSQGWGIDFSYLVGLHLGKPVRIVGMAEVGYEVEKGNIEFMFVWNCNPIHSLPGSDRIVDAVKDGRLFLVVHDPFNNETTKLANVAIPAPTFLEKYDVVYSYWHNYLVYNEPIQRKIGITEIELMRGLAKEIGIIHEGIFKDEWEELEYALRNTGISIKDLKEKKFIKIKSNINALYYNKIKVEPLPPPKSLKMPSKRVLVFSSHPNYTNSQFKEIYGERKLIIYNKYYEGEGWLTSRYGRVKVYFVKDEKVPDNVVFTFKSNLVGIDGKPLNALIGSEKGKYGGTPLLNGTEVEIYVEKGS
ncbi:MAG: dehydrogenase [Sulfolobaceae archaeon]